MKVNRRRVMAGGLAISSAFIAAHSNLAEAGGVASLDPNTRTWLKLVSDLSGRTTFAVETGAVWGFKPQAEDLTAADFGKRLYGYTGLLVRKAETTETGISLKTKGWTFYTDPDTGAIITEVLNPYTGKTVQCPPLSGPVFTAKYGAGQPPTPSLDLRERRIGERAWVEVARLSRFKPADTTWFKLEADLVNYACRAGDLDNATASFIPSTWSHNVVAEWQTWMHMHGTPGHILFKGDGAFLDRLDQTPAPLLAAIEQHFPTTIDAVRAWT